MWRGGVVQDPSLGAGAGRMGHGHGWLIDAWRVRPAPPRPAAGVLRPAAPERAAAATVFRRVPRLVGSCKTNQNVGISLACMLHCIACSQARAQASYCVVSGFMISGVEARRALDGDRWGSTWTYDGPFLGLVQLVGQIFRLYLKYR
jgi:hypothetical protein